MIELLSDVAIVELSKITPKLSLPDMVKLANDILTLDFPPSIIATSVMCLIEPQLPMSLARWLSPVGLKTYTLLKRHDTLAIDAARVVIYNMVHTYTQEAMIFLHSTVYSSVINSIYTHIPHYSIYTPAAVAIISEMDHDATVDPVDRLREWPEDTSTLCVLFKHIMYRLRAQDLGASYVINTASLPALILMMPKVAEHDKFEKWILTNIAPDQMDLFLVGASVYLQSIYLKQLGSMDFDSFVLF